MKKTYIDPRLFDDEPIQGAFEPAFKPRHEETSEKNAEKIRQHDFANLYQSGLKIRVVPRPDLF